MQDETNSTLVNQKNHIMPESEKLSNTVAVVAVAQQQQPSAATSIPEGAATATMLATAAGDLKAASAIEQRHQNVRRIEPPHHNSS